MIPEGKKLVLASRSPRRSRLLREAGIPFTIRYNDVEEDYPPDLPVEEVAAFLARKKAHAAFELIGEEEIILASDSVVILEGKIYGKPADYDDACRILGDLSGKSHLVITGVCLLSKTRERYFSGHSTVYFEPLTAAEIHYYVTNYQPFDKAGAYAIQEWIGLCKVSRIEGTFSNIMGLPVDLVYKELSNF